MHRAWVLCLLVPLVAQERALPTTHVAGRDSVDSVRLVVHTDSARDTISRHIYGQFAEHLGRDIYDGFWVKGADKQWHLRADVIAALRRIKVPNLRWPGGCFADTYHWKDGVGPRPQRPKIVNSTWGGVTEDNSFGTHEYLELVDRIGAAPFIVGNVGSGTPQEMAQWWEYVNFDGVSPMADLRRRNGRPRPWGVRLWGVGNESWGCGGNMTPEYYADVYKRFVTFLPAYGQTRPFRIATGPASEDYRWTEIVMRDAGRMIDALDLHYYTVVGTWAKKGSATTLPAQDANWLQAVYKDVLGRPTVATESSIFVVALNQGEVGARFAIAQGFTTGGTEFHSRLIVTVYQKYLNRPPSSVFARVRMRRTTG